MEKHHIPIWGAERNENDPIVFGGGPVLTANPEPLAPFFDVILLGDGENLLPEFINAMHKIRTLSRCNQLKALAQIEGIYIPSLYAPKYTSDGQLIAIEVTEADVQSSISKQTWQGNTLSHSTVITPNAAWSNIHMVEVVRSCPELCRFCLASYLTLPFRTHSLNDGLIPAIEKGLKVTNRIGLLGASVTQHPQFSDLLKWLNNDRFADIHLSVSSVRAATVTSFMANTLARRGCKSLTIAIESGSERIRQVINKKLLEEEIFASAKYAKEGGLKGMKLYGMVGLPTETDDDIESTADLLLRLKAATPGLNLSLGVSTFVPKAHTPFQWKGVQPKASKRIELLAKRLKPKGINIRPESYKWSVIQALMSRSDRRLAPVIAAVRGPNNTLGGWKKAYKEIREKSTASSSKLPAWKEIVHEDWNLDRILPWKHIQGPLTLDQLIEHHQRALNNLE